MNKYSGHVANIHITVNGQQLEIKLDALNGHIEGTQVSVYIRHGEAKAISFFGGYDSGRVHGASTRTIANMIERYIKEAY